MNAAEALGSILLGLVLAALMAAALYGAGGSVIMDSIPKCTRDLVTHELTCPEIP